MGKLLDMLPEILEDVRAREHMNVVMTFLGCKRLGCTLQISTIPWDFTYQVQHNGQRCAFDHVIGRHRHDGMVVVQAPGSFEPIALVPFAVAGWIDDQHIELEAQRAAERQTAIDADGWLTHAAMVSLV